jgi:hypothetical protein
MVLDGDPLVEILSRTPSRGDESISRVLESWNTFTTASHEVPWWLEKYDKLAKVTVSFPNLD